MKTGFEDDQLLSWLPCNKHAKGLVLLGHGLNLKPLKMLELANFYRELQLDVLLISLSGHRRETFLNKVSYELWFDEVKRALDHAVKVSSERGYPIYFSGFSISTLFFQKVMQDISYPVKKQVLLAPAIALKFPLELLKPFRFLKNSLVLPSFTPIEYRQNHRLNLKAYSSLLSGLDRFQKSPSKKHNIPTLVFCRESDELVSLNGIQKIVKKHDLDQWDIHSIAPRNTGFWQHLLINEQSMGQEDWENFKQKVRLFLE